MPAYPAPPRFDDDTLEALDYLDDQERPAGEPGADLDVDGAGAAPDMDPAAIVAAMGQELLAEFGRRVTDRKPIEDRWRKATNLWNAVYDGAEQERVEGAKRFGSRVFVPAVRRVGSILEARIGDLAFASDDRNFAVNASPEADLSEAQALAAQLPRDAAVQIDGQSMTAEAVHSAMQALRDENDKKAQGMQRVVDDQLQECDYASQARLAIHDGIKLGAGIIKGPAIMGRSKKRWIKTDEGVKLHRSEDLTPRAMRVDPWHFYPDLSASTLEEGEGIFERHPMTSAMLARMASQPELGFDGDAIRRVIAAGVVASTLDSDRVDREASGTQSIESRAFNVIEYNGPISHDRLVAWGARLPEDELLVYTAVAWFSESTGEVIKAVVHPQDTEPVPYSIFCWQRDPGCVLGFGIGDDLGDMQVALNSMLRAALDNGALSVGGQTVINDAAVFPANGRWEDEPRKLWRLKDKAVPVGNVFAHFAVPNHSRELLEVFGVIKALVDETGGVPMAMQGQQQQHLPQDGALGAALRHAASGVWMRRALRNFDDGVTKPLIGRFVDWNMQYHPDDSIKGDLNAVARGTSALLEEDGFAGRLQVLMSASAQAGIPLRRVIAQLRKLALSLRLDPDEVMPDEAEVKQMEEQQAAMGPPPNPEMERLKVREMEMRERQADREHASQMADQNAMLRMRELQANAEQQGRALDADFRQTMVALEAKMQADRSKQANENQRLNAEIATRMATGAGV